MTNLSFAKIVATPTPANWSQAYNAGGLFVVLSLQALNEAAQTELPSIGKSTLDNIQTELFTLEEKTFETLKKALEISIAKINKEITLSLSMVYCKEDTLYAFIVNSGRITFNRGDKTAVILENLDSDAHEIFGSSGYLQSNDLIILQTSQFVEAVPAKIILEALDSTLPNDIAEIISPKIHGDKNGGASAIILSYQGISHDPDEAEAVNEKLGTALEATEAKEPPSHFPINHPPSLTDDSSLSEPQTATAQADGEQKSSSKIALFSPYLKSLLTKLPTHNLSRQKKLLLGITFILTALLLLSIFVVKQNNLANTNHQLFLKLYNSAKKDYDNSESLSSLNKPMALDGYKSAKATLDKAASTIRTNPKDAKLLTDLIAKVDTRLKEFNDARTASLTEAESSSAPVLQALLNNSSLLGATSEDDKVYTLSSKAISEGSKDLVKNNDYWEDPVALGAFSGNFYVLDRKEGLLKFVPTEDDYATSTYFKEDSPDLSTSLSMAIDGSIYILFKDGSISKFTRGSKDSFTISGLDKPLSLASMIYASPDTKDIYILDNGNNRLVRLDTSGQFISEYDSDKFKSAKAVSISKDEKTGYVLSNNKIYKLPL